MLDSTERNTPIPLCGGNKLISFAIDVKAGFNVITVIFNRNRSRARLSKVDLGRMKCGKERGIRKAKTAPAEHPSIRQSRRDWSVCKLTWRGLREMLAKAVGAVVSEMVFASKMRNVKPGMIVSVGMNEVPVASNLHGNGRY